MKRVARSKLLSLFYVSTFLAIPLTSIKADSQTCDKFIPAETGLSRGQSWSSCTGYTLTLQNDGNLVLYASGGRVFWATGTEGSKAERLTFQRDGNLVLYAAGNKPLWASNSLTTNPTLVVQADGNLVVYTSGGKAVWALGTVGKPTGTSNGACVWSGTCGASNSPQPAQTPLFASPTQKNLLRGFLDPLNGNGRYMGAHDPVYNQQYADDIAINIGADIQAMREGKVIDIQQGFADTLQGPAGGNDNTVNYIIIEHDQDVKHSSGNFYRSLYLHVMQNSVHVRVGDRVAAGQIIAKTGNNGTSGGPHLHVDVHYHLGRGIFNRMTVPYVWDNRRNG